MSASMLERYRTLVADGRLEADPAQAELAARLDRLAAALVGYRPGRRARSLGRLVGARPEPPRGVYIHGAVGRGKTLLMDLFFEAAPLAFKRRVHFHAFMADVHARVHRWRQMRKRGEILGDDPIAPVAAALAGEAWLLCFDEFGVRDIADAMILGRLFAALFAAGVVVVATSNAAPGDLYRDGLNRALFLPFVALVRERLDIVELQARTDFRLEKLARAPVYYCPDDARAEAALDAAFQSLTGAARGAPMDIALLGRVLRRRPFFLRRPLSPSSGRGGLSRHRRTLSYARRRSHPHARRGRAQRGQAPHHARRRPLRHAGQADRLGGGRTGRSLLRGGRSGSVRIRPRRLAPRRDALGRLSRRAARRPRPILFRRPRRPRRDLAMKIRRPVPDSAPPL
jgi:predicted ATPase